MCCALALGFLVPCSGLLADLVADPTVEIVTGSGTFGNAVTPGGRLLPAHLHGSVGVTAGYDDNVDTRAAGQGSGTVGTNLDLTYRGTIDRIHLSLEAGTNFTYYLQQVGGRDHDVSAFARVAATYPVSLRLSLDASLDASYQFEPDFASDAGLSRRSGNFLNLNAGLAARYRWSLRLSSSTTYGFRRVQYEDAASAALTDRTEQRFGHGLSFRLSKRASVTANYDVTLVDYDRNNLLNSVTQTISAGGSYRISSQLSVSAQAGASFRSYDTGSDTIDPHFDGSLQYVPGRRTSLNLTVGYGIEEGNTLGAASSTTLRVGLQGSYLITWRITATAGLNYNHSENSTVGSLIPGLGGSAFSQDSFQLTLGLRYVINSRCSLVFNFTHSEDTSELGLQDYARNNFSLGLNYAF